ncbi:hypothetical protein BN59_01803 [Legionella massiliensis]|uniref:Putative DNA-binding domain-containing protein n=1 Tax=Legionella massiliensis TaxID=1034943 RepID=A0A078KSW8_9GAMM|nr:DNA-binding domain-containing protein [Legionella massiliensis]CDZ77520.1 hypothetical protein BN59_01803 [Legionella massiliensis]CEE13258.1 hypothetical protein BN1094_01803 [Legionella massiliensis]
MSDLFKLQSQFQNYLLTNQADIHKAIVATENVTVEKRLSIYSDAYHFRLIDSLGSNFPILMNYLGFDAFSSLAGDYIDKFPSPYRSIRWYGDTFAEYLRETSEPYLAELAEFEWKMTLTFDAADDKALEIEEMAAIPPESWPNLRFVPHASLQLMRFNWNVVAIWEALSNEQEPSPPQSGDSRLWALWRRDYINRFYSLNSDEAWALDALVNGATFGELCEGLCEWHDEQEVGMLSASFLKSWIQSGLIAGIEL